MNSESATKRPSDERLELSYNEFRRFTDEFTNESDRAAVILGAAKLDILLYQILVKRLVPCPNSSDDLLESDSALGTFSSRINMVYRLGLITSSFSRALHMIRKIRNSFAHEISNVSLDSGSHKDRIKELVSAVVCNPEYCRLKTTYICSIPPNLTAKSHAK